MRWLALGLVLVACSNAGTETVVPATASTSTQIPSASTASPPDPGADWVADLLSQLVILDGQVTVPYDRDDWGSGWSDADGDCLSTRHEVLMHEAAESVFLRDDGCLVTGGTWLAEFTGTVVSDPRDLDIDHFVPLANAHRSGAWEWSAETKRSYYNDLTDPRHLIAVTSSANRSKGSRGPDEWKPPEETYWCTYADTWVDIKIRWELSVTTGEMDALQSMLSTCDGPPDLEDLQPAAASALSSGPIPSEPTDTTRTRIRLTWSLMAPTSGSPLGGVCQAQMDNTGVSTFRNCVLPTGRSSVSIPPAPRSIRPSPSRLTVLKSGSFHRRTS